MRIDSSYAPQPAPENSRSSAQSSATRLEQNQMAEDQAQLSGSHASQVQTLAAQASQLPEIREEKVQALRQAVASGNYHPPAQKVALAMMANMVRAVTA